jgi:hypothetical protein
MCKVNFWHRQKYGTPCVDREAFDSVEPLHGFKQLHEILTYKMEEFVTQTLAVLTNIFIGLTTKFFVFRSLLLQLYISNEFFKHLAKP